MLNDVAYEMARAGARVADGWRSTAVGERSGGSIAKGHLQKVQNADLRLTGAISQYWDTLGWIYFKKGDLTRAESYLTSAWQLSQEGVIGDRLGQVYEKERKLRRRFMCTCLHSERIRGWKRLQSACVSWPTFRFRKVS